MGKNGGIGAPLSREHLYTSHEKSSKHLIYTLKWQQVDGFHRIYMWYMELETQQKK